MNTTSTSSRTTTARSVPGADAPLLPIAVGQIDPSPDNPRSEPSASEIVDLAGSLSEHGLLEPIVVRPNPDARGRFLLVAGERRWRAATELGWATIPAIVRTDLDAESALVLTVIENLQRVDLSVWETARGYQALQAQGLSQSEIGRQVGKSQSEIANSIRMLQLPDEVRQMIDGGALSAAHGRALLRWKDFPAVMVALAQEAIARKLTSKDLEGEGLPVVVQNAAVMSVLPRPVAEAICVHACPYAALTKYTGGWHDDYVCLRPEHRPEVEAHYQADRAAKAAAAAEAARQAVAGPHSAPPSVEPSPATPSDAPGDGDRVVGDDADDLDRASPDLPVVQVHDDVEGLAGAIRQAGEMELPLIQDLGDRCEQIYSGMRPAACTDACPCAGKARSFHGDVVDVCLDPGRYASLRRSETRRTNKSRYEVTTELLEKAEARLADPNMQIGRRDLALIVRHVLAHGRLDYAVESEIEKAMLPYSAWKGREWLDLIAELEPSVLYRALLAAIVRSDLVQYGPGHSMTGDPRTSYAAWWLGETEEPSDE